MIIQVANDPRDYAWGSKTAIAALLGRIPSGGHEAELWLGAHPGSPARIVAPKLVGGYSDLRVWLTADPEAALGPRLAPTGKLPFLLKVLAAAAPLSLQAHPTLQQAAAGFARENRLGIRFDDARRNYRDPNHKPELIVALSDRFEALCGFRPVEEVRFILDELGRLDAESVRPRPELLGLMAARIGSAEPLKSALGWILGGSAEVGEFVAHLVELAELAISRGADDVGRALATVRDLARFYPADPGIATALLVQRVTLRRGQALYLPAGNIHAYIQGLGIELMASSDNVLRGGLTSKHIDVQELLEVLDFRPLPVPYLIPEEPVPGMRIFRPDVADFLLIQLSLKGASKELPLDGPAIVLCTRGRAELAGGRGSAVVSLGESVYVTPDEELLTVSGQGEFFIATTGGPQPGVVAEPEAANSHI